jgi:hypothetical protein
VSLLEVLFSIGIVAVGMLGVLIILPVAGSRATHGMVADMADRVGRSAIRQFDVQFMRQPNMQFVPTCPAFPTPPPPYINGGAVCIDPLFVANHITAPGVLGQDAGCFPCIIPATANDTRMRRTTLRTSPGSTSYMQSAQAELIFMCPDDLVVDLPTDRTELAKQTFSEDTSTSPATKIKRQYEGRCSWLATLTPKDTGSDLFVLSIVVFHRRDMTLPSFTPSADEPEGERLVNVVDLQGGGLAGGEMRFEVRDTTPARPDVDLQLGTGDWVMLIGTQPPSPPVTTTYTRRFQWYRVLSVEPNLVDEVRYPPLNNTSDGKKERNVTLFGRDWDPALVTGANRTQAVLLTGVVAVYEKTIRLETSSLWTVQ